MSMVDHDGAGEDSSLPNFFFSRKMEEAEKEGNEGKGSLSRRSLAYLNPLKDLLLFVNISPEPLVAIQVEALAGHLT